MLAPAPGKRSVTIARLLVWPLLIILVIVVCVFYVLYAPARVVGESMLPTLEDGDRLLRTHSYETAQRGDIVIIDTNVAGGIEREDIVKRVVGVPGDSVEVIDDVAYVNGVKESLAHVVYAPGMGTTYQPITIPPGYVFVLGDNRAISLDSRYLGPLPISKIRGRVAYVFLPTSRFKSFGQDSP